MKIRCVTNSLSRKQLNELGYNGDNPQWNNITVGEEYLVLGMSCQYKGIIGPGFMFLDDDGKYDSGSYCLFEIADGRPSKYWVLEDNPGYGCILWHPDFGKNYHFVEDLYDGEPEAVEIFNRVVKQLQEEFPD